jgi:hypothetical protein
VSEDRCPGGVQPLVSIGVVEMMLNIDKFVDGSELIDARALVMLRTRIGKTRIDEQLSVKTGAVRLIVEQRNFSSANKLPGCYFTTLISATTPIRSNGVQTSGTWNSALSSAPAWMSR